MSNSSSLSFDLKPASDLTPDDKEALCVLVAAVYPPEVIDTRPVRYVTWCLPQWRLLVWDEKRLVSHLGIVIREAKLDGVLTRIGGIGGVMTSPEVRGQGYATIAIRRAAAFFDENDIAFALLVCRHELVFFYTYLGWQAFNGTLLVEQPGGTVSFTLNKTMVLPITDKAPQKGSIDLCGLPW
ncbi:GNAT family N-acetyltransferase [Nostoc sp. CHAB 5844]|nr:GNAT family N-acetyltransferase [Nostoc sp. CHAB 5844]